MGIKFAFGCSLLLHMGLLAFKPPSGFLPPRQTLHPLEVYYTDLPRAQARPVHRVTVPPESLHRPGGSPASPPRPVFQPSETPSESRPRPAPPSRPAPVSMFQSPAALKGSIIGLPEGPFASLEYRQLVREHLKRHLRYPLMGLEGAVRLRVFLDQRGKLKEAAVVEASDPRLAVAALEDARQAQPYPRFPKALKRSQVRYEFLVHYQPD